MLRSKDVPAGNVCCMNYCESAVERYRESSFQAALNWRRARRDPIVQSTYHCSGVYNDDGQMSTLRELQSVLFRLPLSGVIFSYQRARRGIFIEGNRLVRVANCNR